jgi:hypothetical protein
MKAGMSSDTTKHAMMPPEKSHMMKQPAADSAAAKRSGMDSIKGTKKPAG